MVTVKLGNWSFGFGTDVKNTRKRPLALIILDGWGHSNQKEHNAIALADTPNYDKLCSKYPQTLLAASGSRVGLTQDTPGNSEVGHLNLGAGRIIQTETNKITEAIKSGEFFKNEKLKNALKKANDRNSSVHLIGLISDGNVHSSMDTLFSLLRMAKENGNKDRVYIHGILDGRDVPVRTADVYIEALQIKLAEIGCGEIATLCGRDYAMDQAEHWERTARAYTMLVHADGVKSFDPINAIQSSFLRGNRDEFIQPIILEKKRGIPVAQVRDDDVVIFFNHRADGIRQLVKSLSISDKNEIKTLGKPKIDTVCLTTYDQTFNLPVAFESEKEANVLGEVFANNGVRDCRLTESERYAHLTYFFDGGAEISHSGERLVLIPSQKISSNDINSESACFKITDKLLTGLENNENDVFLVNLAAADILAQTGNLEKTIEAVQFVDTCLGEIIEKIREIDGIALITSDHGNCEEMFSSEISQNLHTSNPVPFHFVANNLNGLKLRSDGALEDVAPTILGILGIKKPNEMTGKDLRIN